MAYGVQVTSEQRRAVPHLPKYLCRVCEKWKEPASFSNKELGNYTNKIACGNKVNGVSAKLRCRNCSGGALTEKFCEGPCKTWKDLQKFSKSARSNGGSQCCKNCVLWAETQEPGMVTAAPPVGDNIHGEDEDDDHWTPGAATYSDPEAGDSDSDYEDYAHTTTSNAGSRVSNVPAPVPGARQTPSMATGSVGPRQHIAVPYDSLAAMSLNGSNTTSNPGTGHTMATGNLPTPTMSGARNPPGSALMSGSGAASGVGSRNTITQKSFDIKSQSSASNPYENASFGLPWGAVDARRRDPVAQRSATTRFTGWDNSGQPHVQHRTPSSSGTQTPQSSALTPARAPPAPAPVPTARNTNWARPVGSRGAHPTIPPPNGVRPGAAGAIPISRPLADSTSDDEDSDDHNDLYNM